MGIKSNAGLSSVLINTLLLLLALVTVLPFYNVFITSFADPASVAKQQFYLLPTSFSTASYKMLLNGSNVGLALSNTLLVTVLGTVVNMLVTSCGAYALSKKGMPGRNVMMAAIVFTMLFGGGLIPYYLTIKSLHLINHFSVMILPVAVNTFFLIIMISHFRSIPPELEESAKIDGANDIYILFRIVLPISKPTLAAITLFYAVSRWNEWYLAMLFVNDPKKHPMQLFLRNMLIDVTKMRRDDMGADMLSQISQIYPDGLKMACVVVTMLPIMLVYPFLQKYFAAGVTLGAVKE
ncbi:carbohydrate ABC transporter permease [Paenibacillus nasutitermitis]|uniref:ABC transporter permease protein YtcP n=1 Tax=Paenibacillus nasutitermitis TaxID=1652958 RepID=A0A916ZL27_9BACL|nr:carbohydrate ABC transporter permease [Paenibacillus nasutitermitis]GGE02670.1 putative ABC transporter permease protein YtcP [Paenibacillus nasutitermitis]